MARAKLQAKATVREDVARLFDTLADDGVGIVPLDVAYAICASRSGGIQRIFAAKNRSYEKPSGMLGNPDLSQRVHLMDARKHALVETLVSVEKIPFSVVAPFDPDNPVFANVEDFVMQNSSKAGTLDMLLNAGEFHDEIAAQSIERSMPVFGSSANASLTGSKYAYADIDVEVRSVADIHFDYGTSKYANELGRSSTIVDFNSFNVIRQGVVFDAVAAAFARHGVELKVPTA
jgi:tRNA A37 threonylcarbamoyladenosine synthetase subunit TsaC/SUA5/YrdC